MAADVKLLSQPMYNNVYIYIVIHITIQLSANVAADVKLLSQLPSMYHISHAIINEISKRDRGFAPQSMLDVGGEHIKLDFVVQCFQNILFYFNVFLMFPKSV